MAELPYRYEPLDKSKPEIRLLEVVLSSDKSAPVEVKLSTKALSEAISEGFVPFSYSWGDASDTRAIVVDGVTMHVTKNLAALLHHARGVLIPALIQMKGKALFWADALCIDQSNVEERTHQVTLMRDIYGSAELAALWLGPQENAHLAFKVFRTITEQWATPIRRIGGPGFKFEDFDANFGGWMEKNPDFWRKDCDGGMENEHWNAIKELLDSSYWDRVWTYQEIILPKNPFIFTCGSSGESLCVLGNILNMFSWFRKLRSQASTQFPMVDSSVFKLLTSGFHLKVHQIPRIHYALMSKSEGKRDNLKLVTICNGLHASDPRDHVFGLLGLMETGIVADYKQSTSDVYIGFCSAWLTEIGDLSFLRFAGLSLGPDDPVLKLASWVPDWQYVSTNTAADSKSRVIFGGMDCNEYSASAGLTVDDVKVFRPFAQLCLPGIVLEEVYNVTPAWPTDLDQFYSSMLQFLKTAMRAEGISEPAGRLHMFQLLFRTAFLDNYPLNLGKGRLNVSDEITHTLALKFLFFLLMASKKISGESWESVIEQEHPQLGLESGSRFATKYREEIFPNASRVPQLQQWTDAKTALICERDKLGQGLAVRLYFAINGNLKPNVMFTTHSGYLGLSNDAHPGDKIVVVAGCEVPVLLRWNKEVDAFVLVGTCFVLGFMDGEAMQRVREGEAKIEALKIR